MSEETAKRVAKERRAEVRTEWIYRFVVLALLALIFIPFYGAFGLWDPWETHYGEVGRQMIERGDWVSTWWGSHWDQAVTGGQEGTYFYSKPVLLMWLMGMGVEVFGFNEWGIRAGVTAIVIFASFMVYVMGRSIFGRRAGVLMMLVTTTSPFWAMLGRQSQTDMPYVGLMTAGMCFFLLGVFGKDRERKATWVDLTLFIGAFLAFFSPQMQLLWVKFSLPANPELSEAQQFLLHGPNQVAIYCGIVALVLLSLFLFNKRRTKGQIHLLAFYMFIALATLAKGILGFALPGAIILVYLLVSREWWLLLRVQLVRGLLVFAAVAFPWYAAMILRHGREYVERFFIHDHLRRLRSGVHQIDNGSFEHFIKWLGYGLFPWGSFVPAALARVVVGRNVGTRTNRERAHLMLVIWFIVAFGVFTLASTKFHHYIFPCVPALAMMVGLLLNDMLGRKLKAFWPWLVVALALFILVGVDLFSQPQNLKNLFTYQYDRIWEGDLTEGFVFALKTLFWVGLAGMLLMAIRKVAVRLAGIAVLTAAATGMTLWCLNVYMPQLSVDWSQRYLWEAYYSLCTRTEPPNDMPDFKRYCEEPVVAYRLNWRGETYYTQNEVLPLENNTHYRFFLDQNGSQSFYAIMHPHRFSEFEGMLPASLQGGASRVHTENEKFHLVRVLNREDRRALEAWRDRESRASE